MRSGPIVSIVYLAMLILIVPACAAPQISATEALFVPPTALASPSPEPTDIPTESPTNVAPTCHNDLIFVSDITIPDGSVVLPGDALDKRWEVQNTGSCNWDPSYSLRLISGAGLGVADQLPLVPAIAGEIAEIRVEFSAPADPGYYLTEWQVHDANENPFGDSIIIEIVVQE